MADVFVSYKAEDRRRLQALVSALQADGLSVWWDSQIGGGTAWRDSIEAELIAAKCVIVAWSKRSVGPEGTFVRDEASRATERGTYLPVRLDNSRPPLGFGETQALPLDGWKGNRSDSRYAAVLASVCAMIERKLQPTFLAGRTNSSVTRRTAIVGAVAVTAAAAGVGSWLFLGSDPADGSESIAVLPFANLSGDPSQAYFSDGIAEELRSALSRIAGLQVVARTSSEAVRNLDTKMAALRLGVGNILTGSVRRSSGMVRIAAQLIEGRNGMERWSESYDRASGDALQIQSDIAKNVAEALSIRLGVKDKERLAAGSTRNPDAFDLLLKGRATIKEGDGEEIVVRALAIVDAALELDPRYADAWATKANFQATLAGSFAPSAAEAHGRYEQATASAKRAIQLAPRSRVGYRELAKILDQQLRRREAYAQYQAVLAMPGEDAETLAGYAVFLSEMRRPKEAMSYVDRALALDPLNPPLYWAKSYVYGNAREYKQAAEATLQIIKLVPRRRQAIAIHAHYLMLLGNYGAAAAEYEKAGELAPDDMAFRAVLAIRQGDRALSQKLLDQVRAAGDAEYYQQAQILAQQGEVALANAALNKARDARDPGLTQTLVDPLLDPLRKEPQYRAFERSLDFPAA